jgi:hypothetical protein
MQLTVLVKPFHLYILRQSFHKSRIDTCDLAVRNVALAGYRSLKRKKILNQTLTASDQDFVFNPSLNLHSVFHGIIVIKIYRFILNTGKLVC